MRKRALCPLLLCLFGFCLALSGAASGMDGKKPSSAWGGEYLGKNAILRIDGTRDDRSFDFRFEDRENAASARQGRAAPEGRGGCRSQGRDFDFVLSGDGRAVTVTARKKGAAKRGDGAKLAGRYNRLDSLEVRNGRLVLRRTGQPLPEGLATFRPVAHSEMRFATISGSALDEHKPSLRPGIYLASPDGRVRYFTGCLPGDRQDGSPEGFGNMTDAISLSPDKDILAVNWFGALNGEWFFFSWPGMKPLEHPRVEAFKDDTSPGLVWSGGHRVVHEAMDVEGSGRQCEYDPCGPISVVSYDLETGRSRPIFAGTDRCDYRLRSVENGAVTAARLCLPSVADWKSYPENAPTETVTAPLP